MRQLAVIVAVVVMMVPMPVPVTDVNADGADADFHVFSDDGWLVSGVRRSGKCRHDQERNGQKGEQSILHNNSLWLGTLTSRRRDGTRSLNLKSV
jgi:hypothetical protein